MKKILLLTTLVLVLMASLVGCKSKNENNNTNDINNGSTNQEENNNTDQNQEAENNETRIVTDARGEVEIPANPKRIVDLSGNSDILSILGYEVIGTANSDAYDYTKFPSYLEETLSGATILGYSMQDTMDVEAIFALEPDLIIISNYQEKMYDQLKDVAPTVMIELAQMDWREDVLTVAEIMGKVEEANAWFEEYDAKAAEVSTLVKETYGEDTTYLAFLASGGQFFVFDGAAFGSLLYQDLGLAKPEGMPEQENISLPVVNYEGLAAIDADVIFAIGTEEDMAALKDNSVWQGLTPVKEGKVVELPSSPYFNQGYSCIGRMLLLDEIAEMLKTIE